MYRGRGCGGLAETIAFDRSLVCCAVRYQLGCEGESIGKGELVYSDAADVSSQDSIFRFKDSPSDVSYLRLHREIVHQLQPLELCSKERDSLTLLNSPKPPSSLPSIGAPPTSMSTSGCSVHADRRDCAVRVCYLRVEVLMLPCPAAAVDACGKLARKEAR